MSRDRTTHHLRRKAIRRPPLGTAALLALGLLFGCQDSTVGPNPSHVPDPFTPAPPAAGLVAIRNVNIVSLDDGGLLPAHTVILRGELIETVGPASTPIPEGATVIDGTGQWLMPGLMDMHSHLATNYAEFTGRSAPETELDRIAQGQLLLYLANGVTTILGNGDFVEPLPRWGREVKEGQYPGPTIYAGIFARGDGSTPDGGPANRAVRGAADAPAFVQSAHAAGYDFVKLYNFTPAAAVPPLAETAHSLGMGVLGHFPQTLSVERTLDAGLDALSHSAAWYWSFFRGIRPDRTSDAVGLALQSGTSVISTLDISGTVATVWGGSAAGQSAFWARPENRYMHWTEIDLHTRSLGGTRWNPVGSQPGGYDGAFAFIQEYSRTMHDAGIRLMAGTDAPTVFGVAGFSLHRELQRLSDLGLSNEAVLRIATRNPGDFLSDVLPSSDQVGRVSEGYRADLLLLASDPRADLANLTDRVAVIARGRVYPESYLQAGLAQIAEAWPGR